jgi:hypothetical protein
LPATPIAGLPSFTPPLKVTVPMVFQRMFNADEVTVSFNEHVLRKRGIKFALSHSDPEPDGFADQLQHCAESEGSDHTFQSYPSY